MPSASNTHQWMASSDVCSVIHIRNKTSKLALIPGHNHPSFIEHLRQKLRNHCTEWVSPDLLVFYLVTLYGPAHVSCQNKTCHMQLERRDSSPPFHAPILKIIWLKASLDFKNRDVCTSDRSRDKSPTTVFPVHNHQKHVIASDSSVPTSCS